LTGYEPELAKELATHQDDSRFDDFQKIADTKQITMGVGVPTKKDAHVCISMVIFQPHQARQTYSKRYLHPDEEEFFVSGQSFTGLSGDRSNAALAICYELSVPGHAEAAFKNGADIYIASVAKFVNGIDKAIDRLADIAKKYSMTVLMSNCIGISGGAECAGKTSAWNKTGRLAGQLDDNHEGIIIFDTDSQELIKQVI
jgi:predicted amidohydrolase